MLSRSLHRLLAMLAFLLAAAASAAEVETEHLKVELVTERQALVAGSANWVGLRLEHEPHWHTYWANAGDSGLPTRLEWILPPGWSAAPVDWPAPERLRVGELFNFGYSGTTVLPVAITLPAGAADAATAQLRLQASWLVCREECVPGKASLELTLPIAAAGAEPALTSAAPALRAALAQRPVSTDWDAALSENGDMIEVQLRGSSLPDTAGLDAFALQPQILSNAPPRLVREGSVLKLSATRSDYFTTVPAALELVLVQRHEGAVRAWRTSAAWPGSAAAGTGGHAQIVTVSGTVSGAGIALLFALLGGLALNLMPCVFPVLSLKALGLVESAHSPQRARRDGFAYLAGAVTGFVVLAAVLLALRAAGQGLGWGFQLQSPLLVALLAYLMVAMGLSLSGVFVIGARLAGVGQPLAAGAGPRAAFFTGLLACVVASPCTAPFMGPALGYALTQPAGMALAVFATLGIGLALPIAVLGLVPALARWLPRPGAWMNTFKQILAWPLYVTAVWLVWVLMRQAGADAAALTLLGILALVAALLVFGSHQLRPVPAWPQQLAFGLLLLLALAPLPTVSSLSAAPVATDNGLWQAWTPQRLAELRRNGEPVFVNMTAAWCITCLANERVALSSENFAARLRSSGIHYLKGDWTRQDASISTYLASFERSGVPLYVVYPRGSGAPEVLPQLLTPGLVDAALARAASTPTFPATRSSP
ncbi:MAG: thioredoxin family protein [Rhodanobacteraceae bacterium]|nr:thioredoxin family protein [Rhodanobacteraceae bacterium]